jgi:hypothetical protein
MRAAGHVIAQQEPEGLKVTDSTIADLHRVARGEIDTDEVIRNKSFRGDSSKLAQKMQKERDREQVRGNEGNQHGGGIEK